MSVIINDAAKTIAKISARRCLIVNLRSKRLINTAWLAILCHMVIAQVQLHDAVMLVSTPQ